MIIFVANGQVVSWYDDSNAPADGAHGTAERAWVPDDTVLERVPVNPDMPDGVAAIADPRPGLGASYQISLAKQQLADLDKLLPRAVEDVITWQGGDITKLPKVMQDRLTAKRQLRTIISDGN